MLVAKLIVIVVGAYVLCGLAVGVPFVQRGVDRVDAAAKGTSIGFRLLILPGAITLWPVMAAKWIKAQGVGGHV